MAGKLVKTNPTGVRVKERSNANQSPPWVRKMTFATLACAGVVWFFALWYYHNVFVAMTSKIDGDWADCEVVMQERHHITVSLTRMVVAYSQHERDLLTKLTDLRVGREPALDVKTGKAAAGAAAAGATAQEKTAALAPPPSQATVAKAMEQIGQLGPKQLENMFSHLQVVAEQYPQLKLTENFQQFSRAIVETEHRIAELLMQYNKDVNSYMTVRTKYPGRHFAGILRFAPKSFIVVDPEETKFREVSF